MEMLLVNDDRIQPCAHDGHDDRLERFVIQFVPVALNFGSTASGLILGSKSEAGERHPNFRSTNERDLDSPPLAAAKPSSACPLRVPRPCPPCVGPLGSLSRAGPPECHNALRVSTPRTGFCEGCFQAGSTTVGPPGTLAHARMACSSGFGT